MTAPFTPAAERALAAAAAWGRSSVDDGIGLPELLLGLLQEPETRAAESLQLAGIGQEQVLARWPDLTEHAALAPRRAGRWSADLHRVLRDLEERLADDSLPAQIASEQLLLGLAQSECEVGEWLRCAGLSLGEAEVLANSLHGMEAEPLDLEPAVQTESVGEIAVWRTLDAAANRGREGLRVVEDYVRFVLDDRFLTAQFKSLRHELSALLAQLPTELKMAARDTPSDVGATLSVPTESRRSSAAHVAAANLSRTGEALRTLEEFGKLYDSAWASSIETVRYRLYALERAMVVTADSIARLERAQLYVLVDGRDSVEEFAALASELVSAGVDVIQLRDKRLPDRDLMARARVLGEKTRGTATLFVMNDRPDLAMLAEADGVHVGQDELPIKYVRRIVGPRMLVGVSTHSLDEARRAVLDGANYIGVGPTFPSQTKEFSEFPGLELLRAVSQELRLPAFAIGGITPENLHAVLATGIRRIAVSGAVAQSATPGRVASELLRRLTDNANPTCQAPAT